MTIFLALLYERPLLLDESAEAVAVDLVEVLLHETEPVPGQRDKREKEERIVERLVTTYVCCGGICSPVNLVKVLLDESLKSISVNLVKVPLAKPEGGASGTESGMAKDPD